MGGEGKQEIPDYAAKITREAYDRIAEDWHRDHADDDWWIDGAKRFATGLFNGGTVLDVGCGGGTKARWLAERGFQVTGIDVSEAMLAIARREAPMATFERMDMRDLGALRDSWFDGIFAQASLLHIPKTEVPAVLDGFRAKLRRGGDLYVAVKERREGQEEETVFEEDDYGYPYRRFFSYFTRVELVNLLRDGGYACETVFVTESGNSRWLQAIAMRP